MTCIPFPSSRELEIEGEGGSVEVGFSSSNSQTAFAGSYLFAIERVMEGENTMEFEHTFTFQDDNEGDMFQVCVQGCMCVCPVYGRVMDFNIGRLQCSTHIACASKVNLQQVSAVHLRL